MRKAGLVTILLAVSTAPVFAQSEGAGYMAGVGGGVSIPTSEFRDRYDIGGSFAGYVNGRIVGTLGWRIETAFDYLRADPDVLLAPDFNAREFHFGGGVQLTVPHGERASVVTYGYATIGSYTFDANTDLVDSNTDFGMAFGTGVLFKAGPRWGVSFDFQVNGVVTDHRSWDWYIAPRAYLTWLF